jgi:hypothetical protein
MAGVCVSLEDYVSDAASKSFVWGLSDCASFAIGWLDICCNSNALPKWLGKYFTEKECKMLIAENGGFFAFADKFITSNYGLTLTSKPEVGNVLLADIVGREHLALRLNGGMIATVLSPSGLRLTRRFKVLAEWEVHKCHQS